MGRLTRDILLIFLTIALISITTGCMSSEQQLLLERQIHEMNSRLESLERGVETLREGRIDETSQRLETLARQQADHQAGLDGLRVEFQGIVGRFDDAASEREQLRQDLNLLREDIDLRLAALEAQSTEPQKAPLPPEETLAPPPELTSEEFYKQGLSLIREQKDFVAGREILQKFLEQFPTSELRPNATYWIGEAYYAEKDFENAIVQFQEVIDSFPKHPKAAGSLLKQGLSFQGMGKQENARTIFTRLLEEYPESEETQRASSLLEEMNE